MKEVVYDYFVFFSADEAEKALEKMRRAIGKKNETATALKFAHAMLNMHSKRMSVKDEAIENRLALLRTYDKLMAVRNEAKKAADFALRTASKVYGEYHAQGGDNYEAKAYWSGRTREEVIKEEFEKPLLVITDTRAAEGAQEVVRME